MRQRHALATLPNIVSCSRLVLAAGFVAAGSTEARAGLIGVAAVTDFLDGWIARRMNAASRWGALIDPLADRVFVLTVAATLVLAAEIGTTAYFILIARDLATAVGFLVARAVPRLRRVTFVARLSGKVVTGLQLATLLAVLVLPSAVTVLLAALATASVLAIADYTMMLWRVRPR